MLRPFIMAAGLLLLLGAAAVIAYLVVGGQGYTLTVTKPNGGTLHGGGVRCGSDGGDCSVSISPGEVVELAATPDEGYSFAGFTGDCAPVGRVLMGGPRTCGAEFAKMEGGSGRTWPLTITPAAGGTILSDVGHQCGGQHTTCTVNVPEGTVVKIEGFTEQGYSVAAYTGDCAPQGTTTMTQARTCSATFVRFAVGSVPGTSPAPTPYPMPSAPPSSPGARGPVPGPVPGPPPPGRDRPATQVAQTPRADAPATPAGTPTSTPTAAPSSQGTPEVVEPTPGKDGDGAHERAIKLAQDEIKKTLLAYRNAYVRMDIEALRRLQPGLDVRRHQFEFGNLKSVKYDFEGDVEVKPEEIDTATGRATVHVGVKTENTPKAGKKEKPVEWQSVFTLKRINTSANWVIETLDNRPK